MASTRLTKTVGAGNRKTWTWSGWVKRSQIGTATNAILATYVHANDEFRIYFADTDKISMRFYNGTEYILGTTRVFRDTNAWYHLVFVADTTNSTTNDRFRIYVNGTRETAFDANSQPTQNLSMSINDSNTMEIGSFNNGSFFDGSMSHVHFIDGTAYDASAFGETDATTGEWKIKTSPSVTYGTNGFFILKDGNSVTDQSGNSNNFTVGGGTLTNTEDCPSNVFNTFNPLDDYYEAGTFFNGNTTYQTGTAAGKYGRNTSTLGMTSGKFYWEVKPVSVNTSIDYYPVIGITASQITGSQDFVGKASTDYSWSTNQDGSNTVKYNNNSNISWGNHFALNSIVGVAVDLDNNKIYFSKDGVWQESGDPTSGSTGTGAAFTITSASSTPLGAYFPSLSNYDGTGYVKFEANFGNGYFGTTAVASAGTNASGNGIFEYDVPTGYTALSTKGLNL